MTAPRNTPGCYQLTPSPAQPKSLRLTGVPWVGTASPTCQVMQNDIENLATCFYQNSPWWMYRGGTEMSITGFMARRGQLTPLGAPGKYLRLASSGKVGLKGTAWVQTCPHLPGKIRQSYLFRRENTQGASVLPHGHPHLGQQGFPAGAAGAEVVKDTLDPAATRHHPPRVPTGGDPARVMPHARQVLQPCAE